MRFHVLLAMSRKMTIFWDVTPCSVVEVDQRFGSSYCLHHQDALMTRAVSISETSVNL
jgi:hypothetical protein